MTALTIWRPERNRIYTWDALQFVWQLPDDSLNCVITSPPYYGLRDYQADGQYGLEDTPDQYVARLVELFRLIRRNLRPDGTCWIVLGDSYANDGKWGGSSGGKHVKALHGNTGVGRRKRNTGLKPKDLIGIPWRVALALQADGWWLRNCIVWDKVNAMPESVTDRCTMSHEYVFLLTKSARYWFDRDAIKVNKSDFSIEREQYPRAAIEKYVNADREIIGSIQSLNTNRHPANNIMTANKRTVWAVKTQAFEGMHFATFPPELIRPMIRAGCPRQVCAACGAPYRAVVERETVLAPDWKPYDGSKSVNEDDNHAYKRISGNVRRFREAGRDHDNPFPKRAVTGYAPSCACGTTETVPGLVFDPFMGAGTTGLVASQEGRDYIGSEINPVYAAMAGRRIANADPTQPTVHEDGNIQLSLFNEAI